MGQHSQLVVYSLGNVQPVHQNHTKLVHWPFVDGWVVTFGTAWRGLGGLRPRPSPLLAVPNETAHPLMASVPVTVLLHEGPLLCGFNVAIKGLSSTSEARDLGYVVVLWFVCSFVCLTPATRTTAGGGSLPCRPLGPYRLFMMTGK